MMGDHFVRAARFVELMQDRMAERRIRLAHGTALFHDRLPQAWDLNFVRLNAEDRGLVVQDLVGEVDVAFEAAGLTHRKLRVDVGAMGSGLEPELRAMGWQATESLVMVHRTTTASRLVTQVVEVTTACHSPRLITSAAAYTTRSPARSGERSWFSGSAAAVTGLPGPGAATTVVPVRCQARRHRRPSGRR
jgi:hypothetical protein